MEDDAVCKNETSSVPSSHNITGEEVTPETPIEMPMETAEIISEMTESFITKAIKKITGK